MRKVLVAGSAPLARVRLFLIAAAACFVLSFGFAEMTAAPAEAHLPLSGTVANAGGRNATGCPNETVLAFGKPTTLRFVLHGVSCSQAHAQIRTYFRTATTQTCRNAGTACALTFPGGWSCSFIFSGEGPGYAGCANSQSERFTTFRVTRHTGSLPPKSAAEFYWTAGACAMGPGPIAPGKPDQPDRVLCQSAADVVSLLPSGRVHICTGGMTNLKCLWGNVGENTPKLAPGRQRTVGPFRCSSAKTSITCVVIKTKVGFQLTATGATKVG